MVEFWNNLELFLESMPNQIDELESLITGNEIVLSARGRHDPCVLPRAVPIVEAMMALVLVDHLLRQNAKNLENSVS